MFAAVLFDLDETLFARTASLKRFVEDQLGRQYANLFPNLEQAVSRFLELDNRGMRPKDEVYRTLLVEFGRADEVLATELAEHYETSSWRFASAFEGISEAFDEIKELGCKIGVVTNGQTRIQLQSIRALNLDQLVDDYVISEAVGLRKPDPMIFHLAARNLSVRADSCVFVGDSPTADIVGSRNAGMKTVWFPNGAVWPINLSPEADAEIHSLSELGTVLRRLS